MVNRVVLISSVSGRDSSDCGLGCCSLLFLFLVPPLYFFLLFCFPFRNQDIFCIILRPLDYMWPRLKEKDEYMIPHMTTCDIYRHI